MTDDTQTYSMAEVRKLLDATFDSVGLVALCQDEFPDLSDSLGRGMRKDEILNLILSYSRRHGYLPRLLTAIQIREPELYGRFELSLPRAVARHVTIAATPRLHSYPRRRKEDWGEAIDVSHFYGRGDELANLEPWIIADRCRLLALLGIGGIGKTSFAVKLVQQVKDQFSYIFWRDLRNAPPIAKILGDCIKFISDQQKTVLPEDIDSKISLLVHYLRTHCCLLVLDNAEAILRGGYHVGQYREGYEDYGKLIRRVGETSHQSCLLLTSREKPKEVASLEGETSPVRSWRLAGLGQIAGRELLREKDLFGPEDAWTTLINRYVGNPLALKQVSATIQDLFSGDIAGFLGQGTAVFGGIRDLLDQQFDRLSELETMIMYWLAIERDVTSIEDLSENIVRPVSRWELLEALGSLRRRSLIEAIAARFTLQPVVMEYVTGQLIRQVCEEIANGEIAFFDEYALIKAAAREYIRNSQVRLILGPISDRLLATTGKKGIEVRLARVLSTVREQSPQAPGYAGGNTVSLLCQLGSDLNGWDFSQLSMWQAYLQDVDLPDVDFSYSNLSKSVFTETFGSILSVAFSPDGKRFAAGGTDGRIRLWQVIDGRHLFTYAGYLDWIWAIAFSPDNHTLATGSTDHTVRLWDVTTGECLGTLRGHTDRLRTVAFSPDGRILASCSVDQTIRLWSVASSQCLKTLRGHAKPVWSVAFSPDGSIVASGSEDQTIRLWDAKTGECLKILHVQTRIWSVAFSPNGITLASGGADPVVRLWDISTGQCFEVLQGHASQVWSVAFNSDGSRLVSGSDDKTLRMWDVTTGQCLQTLQGHTNRVWTVAFNSDGKTLLSGSDDKTVRLWDVNGDSIRVLHGYTNQILSVASSLDNRTFASGSEDQAVRLWDINTGRTLKALRGHSSRICSVAFSPDNVTLASGSDDQTVRLWNIKLGQPLETLSGHTHQVRATAFCLKGRILASGSDDQTIRLWDVKTGQSLKTLPGHAHRVRAVACSPDGRILASGSDDQTIRLWDVKTGQLLKTLSGHEHYIRALAFSPDGSIIASGSDDQTIRLWDVKTGQLRRILQGHTSRVRAVACSPDGETVASGGDDASIRLWDLASGQLKVSEEGIGQISSLAFTPDSCILLSGGDDQNIRLWDVLTGGCRKILRCERPYEGMKIAGITGVTEAQKATLRDLGAIES